MNVLRFLFVLVSLFAAAKTVEAVDFIKNDNDKTTVYVLQNSKIKQVVVVKNGLLGSDTLVALRQWSGSCHRRPMVLVSDGGFSFSVVWTGLRAPGMKNNAENPVVFSKNDFEFTHHVLTVDDKSQKRLDLFFKGKNNPFEVRVSYLLSDGDFFVRRSVTLRDKGLHGHFLHKTNPRSGIFVFDERGSGPQKINIGIEGLGFGYSEEVKSEDNEYSGFKILKNGGFGQPVAFAGNNGGGFIAIEYPAATNNVKLLKDDVFSVDCYQYYGEKIEDTFAESEWVVSAVTPEPYVKKWFFDYLDDIRVAPAKPYIMYNSWYDLRSQYMADYYKSKGYADIPADAVMNTENTLRIIRLIRENMIKKHGIRLDAFVLDDGWDVYKSDWKLDAGEFPEGMRPIADTLAKTNTRLGIWFGPMGGYSFAMDRVKWMDAHGYEVTGHKFVYGSAKLCMAGTNYSNLFTKRITDFVRDDNVGYFKWDGIQFSCSEPGHGHPVGVYSQRAVMQSVIDKCNAVRHIDSTVYLNITTGTWLSPFWLKYANQIWMDAADYAFADVPSISRRDNAMTYRDYALYDDLKVRKMWIPVSNLMTHGIIKGRLENISKGGEPFDRFTNNAVLYFARGITMWELYISPDILTDDEWNVLSQSIKWAEANAGIMKTTYMTGGNPAVGHTYGYLHFKDKSGLIAVRNPKVESDVIRINLSPEYGLDEDAAGLVVEQIYPVRRILPELYSAGGILNIDLDGFETAVFRVFPLDSCKRPLLAGADFSVNIAGDNYEYLIYGPGEHMRFLNPQLITGMKKDGKDIGLNSLSSYENIDRNNISYKVSETRKKDKFVITVSPDTSGGNHPAGLALLMLGTDKDKDFPKVDFTMKGKKLKVVTEKIKGKWIWYSVNIDGAGAEDVVITVEHMPGNAGLQLWVENVNERKPVKLTVKTATSPVQPVLPPLPHSPKEKRKYVLLKSF